MATLEVIAHLTVRPGQLEGFKKASGGVHPDHEREGHADTALRLVPHQRRHRVRSAGGIPPRKGRSNTTTLILEARTKLFEHYADNHFMTVFGEPTGAPARLLKAHTRNSIPVVLTSCKGLEPSAADSRRGFLWPRLALLAG